MLCLSTDSTVLRRTIVRYNKRPLSVPYDKRPSGARIISFIFVCWSIPSKSSLCFTCICLLSFNTLFDSQCLKFCANCHKWMACLAFALTLYQVLFLLITSHSLEPYLVANPDRFSLFHLFAV